LAQPLAGKADFCFLPKVLEVQVVRFGHAGEVEKIFHTLYLPHLFNAFGFGRSH
jgi:hypothetical protein